jgi:hypothetical protein
VTRVADRATHTTLQEVKRMDRPGVPTVISVLLLAACGDPTETPSDGGDGGAADASPDAPISTGPCWPTELPTGVTGTATLGTGFASFEAMPSELPLYYGAQGGFNIVANVHMDGFNPGNPKNVLDPQNPRTRIRAFFVDTGLPLNFYANCPFRSAYKSAAGGGYELGEGVAILFETCWRSNHLIGAQVRIDLELVDTTNSTLDSKLVTLGSPTDPYPMETGVAGCMH